MLRGLMILLSNENFKIIIKLIFLGIPILTIIVVTLIRDAKVEKLRFELKYKPSENYKYFKKLEKKKKLEGKNETGR